MTGAEIRFIRGEMSRFDFAKIVGCTERQVARWEKRALLDVNMHPMFEKKLLLLWKRRRDKLVCDSERKE